MNTHESGDRTQREAELDVALQSLLAQPVDTERLLRGAQRRITRWRWIRVLTPWLVAIAISVALGPVLWRLAGGLVGTLPSVGVQFEFTPAGVAALAEQLPVYVWAFVAGIGVTVAATLAER
ncbi:MAG: hypothetical protein AAFV30_06375 [Pseudomonadota bacterium]